MSATFSKLVEEILDLTIDEKEEIQNILYHSITDQRRQEIEKKYFQAKNEEKTSQLVFSSKIDELKTQI